MRAVRLHEIGGTPVVDEVEQPTDPSMLQIAAAALNPVDVSIGAGRFYAGIPATPYVIGSEAIGVTPDGARVWARGQGLMAEFVPSPEWRFDVPDGVSDSLALACGVAGLTGWLAVSWRAPVRPEDTVLVLGASGTLGATALQAAKLLGARRVIGAARRVDRVPASADEVVSLAGDAELPAATLIVDGLFGAPLERALAAAATGVRIVQLGESAGPTAILRSGWIRGKVAAILGHSLFAVPPEVARAGFAELCEHARTGRIAFAVDRYPLAEVGAAWERQGSASPGAKIVVEVS